MKLHLPLRLRAGLLACLLSLPVFHTTIASGAGVAVDKTPLTVPTLGSTDSVYTLTETAAPRDFTLTKYTWDAATLTLTPVLYELDIKSLGTEVSFSWTDSTLAPGNWVLTEDVPYSASSDVTASIAATTRVDSLTGSIGRNFVGVLLEIDYDNTPGVIVASAFGGALSYRTELSDFSITGHFIGNIALATADMACDSHGGALYSTKAIEHLNGDFIRNSAQVIAPTTSAEAHGGAIYSTSSIGSITGDFIANYSFAKTVDNAMVRGGAIYSESGIGDIYGDFIDNYVQGVTSGTDDTRTFSIGGAIYTQSNVDTITGDFIGNSARPSAEIFSYGQGGALFNSGTITEIEGAFVDNHVISGSAASGNASSYSTLSGGAIFNQTRYSSGGVISTIKADFLSNYIQAKGTMRSESFGGVLYNLAQVDRIEGIFLGNYAHAETDNPSYNGQVNATAYGGVIYNNDDEAVIKHIVGDFIGNHVQSSASSPSGNKALTHAAGGAIYNTSGAIIANVTGDFLGNYVEILKYDSSFSSARGGAIRNYNSTIGLLALTRSMEFTGNYTLKDGEKTSNAIYNDSRGVLYFNSYDGYTITVNDGISGDSFYRDGQDLNINKGIDGEGNAITGGMAFSTVAFNNEVSYQTINVYGGTLSLGDFAGTTLDSGQVVGASSAKLTSAELNVMAGGSVITKAAYLGRGNTITNAGSMSIGTGTLHNAISSSGQITLTGDVELESALSLSYTAGSSEAALSFASGASLTKGSSGSLSINLTGGIVWTDFITWEDTSERLTAEELSSIMTININGVDSSSSGYQLTETAQGFSFSEVWNAKYELVAVPAGDTPALFSVTNDDGNEYNVVIADPLGEPSAAPMMYFYWDQIWDENRDRRGILLKTTTDENLADISANSSNNVAVDTSLASWGTQTEVNHSFIGLTETALSHSLSGRTLRVDSDFVANTITIDRVYHNDNNNRYDLKVDHTGIDNSSTIDLLKGNFVGNAVIVDSGFRSANSVETIFSTVVAQGSAIYNKTGIITDIAGDFLANSITVNYHVLYDHEDDIEPTSAGLTVDIQGGAIFNENHIESISGDFIGNYVYADLTIFHSNGNARYNVYGGAIHNEGTIARLEGNFIGNYAALNISKSRDAHGGAISNLGGNIGIIALTRSTHFTDNHTWEVSGSSAKHDEYYSNAIYNAGNATIRMNAYGTHTITVNDTITGSVNMKNSQQIMINDGKDGADQEINAEGAEFSTVYFNNIVSDQSISVHAGQLIIGSYDGAETELLRSSLTVYKGAQVTTDVSYLGTGNTITNNGNITLSGDRLLNLITGDGTIYATTDLMSSADYLGNEVVISPDVTLTLTAGELMKEIRGGEGSKIKIDGYVTTDVNYLAQDTEIAKDAKLTLKADTYETVHDLGVKISGEGLLSVGVHLNAHASDLLVDSEVQAGYELTITGGSLRKTILGHGDATLNILENVSSSGDYIKIETEIAAGKELILTGGLLGGYVRGDGILRIADDMAANADRLKADTVIDSGITLSLKTGIHDGRLKGVIRGTDETSKLKITEDVYTDADYLQMASSIDSGVKLILTGGTVAHDISGDGSLLIEGDVSSHASKLLMASAINGSTYTLKISGGTIAEEVSGSGLLKITGDTSAHADLLKTRTSIDGTHTLSLTGGTLTKDVTFASSTGRLSVLSSVTSNASLTLNELAMSYNATAATPVALGLHLAEGSALSFNSLGFISLDFTGDTDNNEWKNFLSWSSGHSASDIAEWEKLLKVSYNGLALTSEYYTISETGDAFTLTINTQNEVKYQLVPLEPSSPLETLLVVNPSVGGIPVASSVVFDGPLGDDIDETVSGVTGEIGTFDWAFTPDGVIFLNNSSEERSDIIIYSANNTPVDTSDASFTETEVKHSIFGQEIFNTTYDSDFKGIAINHTKDLSIDVSADLVANYVQIYVDSLTVGQADNQIRGIAVYNDSQIGIFTGDIVGNLVNMYVVVASSDEGDLNSKALSQGVGMYNAGSVDELHADFIANVNAVALEASGTATQNAYTQITAQGAGLYNEGTLDEVTSDFIGNFIFIRTIHTGAEGSSSTFIAQGAGFYNTGDDVTMESDFIGNEIVVIAGTGVAEGAALYNAGGSIVLSASSRSIQMTDNSVTMGGKTSSSGIFNAGAAGDVASITLNAVGKETITINDSISGLLLEKANQLLHINKSGAGTVYFNNLVENQSLTVHAGSLELGTYHAASAMLKNIDLQILKDASLSTVAEFLGQGNTINNSGTVYLAGGTLTNAVTGTGLIYITGDTESAATLLGSAVSIVGENELSLTDGVLGAKVTGNNSLKIVGDVSANADYLNIVSDVGDGHKLTLTEGEVTKNIGGLGSLEIAGEVSTHADFIKMASTVVDGAELTLTGGEIREKISGLGSLEIVNDVTTHASNLNVLSRITASGDNLYITGGTITHRISGDGIINIIGNNTTPEDTISQADLLRARTSVADGQTLHLTGGTLTEEVKFVGSTGTLNIQGRVTSDASLTLRELSMSYDATALVRDAVSLHLDENHSFNSLSSLNLNFTGNSRNREWTDFLSWASVDTEAQARKAIDLLQVSYNGTQLHSDFYTISETGDAYTLIINSYIDEKYQLIAVDPTVGALNEFVVNPSVGGSSVASSVVFSGPLGDDPDKTPSGVTGESAAFSWNRFSSGVVALEDTAQDPDISIYSIKNEVVNTSDASFTGTEVEYSIFSQSMKLSTATSAIQGTVLSHTSNTDAINVLGDIVNNEAIISFRSNTYTDIDIAIKGAAVYNESTIGIYSGDIVGNEVVLLPHIDYSPSMGVTNIISSVSAQGTGMHNAGTVNDLRGDFIANVTGVQPIYIASESIDSSVTSQGSGLYNAGELKHVTSDFVGNHILAATTYGNAATVDASMVIQGAGLYNNSDISYMESDFIGNRLNLIGEGDAKGAALYNAGGSIVLVAESRSIQMTDNTSTVDSVTSSSGIYNAGAAGDEASITLKAIGEKTITINDSISGDAGQHDYQQLRVNDGGDGVVYFNNLVENQSITLHAGELMLGQYNGAHALLRDVSLDVASGASLTTYADYLGDSSNIVNEGTVNIAGGTLENALTGGGTIYITENTASDADLLGNNVMVSPDKALILKANELSVLVSGEGSLVIDGEVTANADLLGANTQINEDKTLILEGGGINSLISGQGTARIATDMLVNNDNLASRVSVDKDVTLTLEACELRQDISGEGRVDIVGAVSYYSSHTNTGGTQLRDGDNQLNIAGNHNHTLSGTALTMHGSDGSLTKLHVTAGSALSFASDDSLIKLYATDTDPAAENFSWTIISWENGAHMVSQGELLRHLQLNDYSNLEEKGFYITLGDDSLSYILTDERPSPSTYHIMAWSYNGKAGVNLLDGTVASGMKAGMDLQDVLTSMDEIYKENSAATTESDRLAAALAGASVTSIGSSMMSNIRGQLQKVRNRAGGFVPEGESNFWISAENSRYKLDGEGTAAGHNISNWGGSVGVQRGVSEETSIGFAFTALYGDLDAHSVDRAEGDMDSVFASFMAQHQSGMWTHHFIASYGHADITLDRSVSHRNGSYETEGKTKGYSLGFMYEVGYDMQLSESTVLTPVLNASIAHSYVDGYTETGSDAALNVGEQENTYATIGAGARIAHTFDMGLQLGARALVKFDAGGSEQETEVRLAEVAGSYGHLRGTEAGVMGFELGMGASLPVGESGALFMDATVELRDNQENYNASVGYKLSF